MGKVSTGWVTTISLIFGWPDHALDNDMSTCTRLMVRRVMPLRSLGFWSVRSFSATFSVGHRLILVVPSIDRR